MRLLLTGNEGFVGSHIQTALEADNHEVVGLEAKPTFREWYEVLYDVMDTPIDAVIHAGAIADNQCQDPNIYLWNSHATFLLAQQVRQKMMSMSPMPFIFFSSFLVESTSENWETRTPYSWSKAMAEQYVQVYLPHAMILRPGVMWGDERCKPPQYSSVPFRLAAHNLEFLFRNWTRNYVHVDDVVDAVQNCLKHKLKGIYGLHHPYAWSNEELAKQVKWNGFEWKDNPLDVGFNYVSDYTPPVSPTVPGWKPSKMMEIELPRLEIELHG